MDPHVQPRGDKRPIMSRWIWKTYYHSRKNLFAFVYIYNYQTMIVESKIEIDIFNCMKNRI